MFRQFVAVFAASVLWTGIAQAQVSFDQNETLSRRVPGGRETLIKIYWSINEDCSTRRGFTVSILTPPSHGEVDLRKTERVINEAIIRNAPGNLHAHAQRCMGRPIQIISVFYKPQAGFVGFDTIVARVQWTETARATHDMRIAVR